MEKNIFYHDKEGRLVQILDQAVMRENERTVVLYQELFGSYARKVEYKDVFLDSMSAFEGEFPGDEKLISPEKAGAFGGNETFGAKEDSKTNRELENGSFSAEAMSSAAEGLSDTEEASGMAQGSPQELLMAFLDARTNNEKLEILYQMKDCVTDYLIDTMALSMDMEIPQGVLEDRYQKLIRSLRTVIKYETNRLR